MHAHGLPQLTDWHVHMVPPPVLLVGQPVTGEYFKQLQLDTLSHVQMRCVLTTVSQLQYVPTIIPSIALSVDAVPSSTKYVFMPGLKMLLPSTMISI